MVIDMNEAQVRTVEQVRQVLEGTQALQFHAAEDDEGRYRWIDTALRRLGYRQLGRSDRGAVLAYLQRLSGYSRAQVTRLVSRWMAGKPLVKNYRAPEHAFARRYTGADVALLATGTQKYSGIGRPQAKEPNDTPPLMTMTFTSLLNSIFCRNLRGATGGHHGTSTPAKYRHRALSNPGRSQSTYSGIDSKVRSRNFPRRS